MSASFVKLVELGRLWASSIQNGSGVENGFSLEVEQFTLDKLPSQKENILPTIIYQGQTVKLRECTFKMNFLRRWTICPFEG